MENDNISIDEVIEIFNNVKIIEEPLITFPQANSFERIVNLLEILNYDKYHTKDELSKIFYFDDRQTDYYCNAARYLGLIQTGILIVNNEKKNIILMTDKGRDIFNSKYKERQLSLVSIILEHRPFYEMFKLLLNNPNPTIDDKIRCIKSAISDEYSEETLKRRISTITSWIKWINELYKEIEI